MNRLPHCCAVGVGVVGRGGGLVVLVSKGLNLMLELVKLSVRDGEVEL